jgi:hypothetical protein
MHVYIKIHNKKNVLFIIKYHRCKYLYMYTVFNGWAYSKRGMSEWMLFNIEYRVVLVDQKVWGEALLESC